ncbi:MAG: hypothetical protein ETSY2_21425 [Candidatus Entotheonella gemina]|uniref:Nitroreductase n=2 Tax=Candidatus Entotheonella TaxID=93171 RepID=W4M685_9BACT|nr:MAG: hypothetical protein ETSY2_21425 [Candidatus Entotheonella gemina]
MTTSPNITEDLEAHKYLYLTTVGRKSGLRRRIEIWFTVYDHRIYLISGGGTRSDWVRNLLVNPAVKIEIGPHCWRGTATPDDAPGHPARERLAARYQHWTPGEPLTDWARTGLVIELRIDASQPPPATS